MKCDFESKIQTSSLESKIIVGFGDIDDTGYLDRLYVHINYQRKDVATAICNKLEQAVQGKVFTHASITAFVMEKGWLFRAK